MFSQSNFGVVTKMGFWLMPEPDAYLTGTVTVPKYEDLTPLIDILTLLENSGISNGMPGLGSPILGRLHDAAADARRNGHAAKRRRRFARAA